MSAISGIPPTLIGAPAMSSSTVSSTGPARAQYSLSPPRNPNYGMGSGGYDLGLDDDDEDNGPDRDSMAMKGASARGAGRERMLSGLPGGGMGAAWGGSLRRMADSGPLAPSREDEMRLTDVPGRYVPVAYARYTSPVVNPWDFTYYRVAGWRVAVPRATPGLRVRDLLYRIEYFGPQAAGYARVGDTLVPAILGPGDRATLANSAVEFYAEPLSS